MRVFLAMQLPLVPPAVLVALLAPAPTGAAPAAHTTAEDAPAQVLASASTDVLPPTAPCPAYLGPQCSSQAHEQWVTGQDIVDLANRPLAA
jgi:hypothetical protein